MIYNPGDSGLVLVQNGYTGRLIAYVHLISCPIGSKSLRRIVILMKRRTSSSVVQRGKKYCFCVYTVLVSCEFSSPGFSVTLDFLPSYYVPLFV